MKTVRDRMCRLIDVMKVQSVAVEFVHLHDVLANGEILHRAKMPTSFSLPLSIVSGFRSS